MLARDGRVVADDGTRGGERYVRTYLREHTLVSQTSIESASGVQKLIAEIVRYPGGYLRFTGPVTLDHYRDGELVEHHEALGSFEECYWQRTIHGDR